MPTISPEEEKRIQLVIHDKREGKFTSWKDATNHHKVNYDVTRTRARGRLPNSSKGGKNKALNTEEEAALKLYISRLIKAGKNPQPKHIVTAANSILRATNRKCKNKVSKQWITRWTAANKDFIKLRFSKPLAAERKAAYEYTEIADHFW